MFLVLQYDNRPINNLDMGVINRNVDYCNQHKYHHRFITINSEASTIFILHFCSDKNKRYNYLLTMQQPM